MKQPENNIERLPKWAQQEIRRLRADLALTQKRLDAALEAAGFSDPQGPFDYAIVPTGERAVRFRGSDPGTYIEIRPRDKGLELLGYRGLILSPEARNVVTVSLEE